LKGRKVPLATETAPVIPIEAIADPAIEPESEKVAEKVPEQPKIMVTVTVIALPKLSTTTAGTPRKHRMTSVLDVVLESVKTPPPTSIVASGGKIEDAREMDTASTSSVHAEAGPSETALESLMEESLPRKPSSPAPEAPSFIVRHASGKRLSIEQVAETKHYAK
jgi:hypothetical protein